MILEDVKAGAYFQLSEHGMFVWRRLDGRTAVADIIRELFAAHRIFAPQLVLSIVANLAGAGFVTGAPEATELAHKRSRLGRIGARARAILEWRVSARGLRRLFSRCYGASQFLFTGGGQLALAALAIVGAIAFGLAAVDATSTLRSGVEAIHLAIAVPALLAGIAVHELGHALTAAHAGRAPDRAGVGWYWFMPIAFVDTSEMWLADRRARVAVAMAGPYTTVIFAGIASLAAWWLPAGDVATALWLVALMSYATAVWNMNPLLELDGYYALMDWTERPNLRERALAFLGRELFRGLRAPKLLMGRGVELVYAAAALAYLVAMSVVVMCLHRAFAADVLARHLPGGAAAVLTWTLALALVALVTAATAGQLGGVSMRGENDA